MAVHEAQMAISSKRPNFSSFEEQREYIRSIQSKPVGWQIISKAWSLMQNGRDDLAQNFLIQYKDPTYDGPSKLNHILFHFCWDLTKPKYWLMYKAARDLKAEISYRFLSEYHRFLDYYLSNLYSENLQRYFDIFSEYFQEFSEFNQTLM
jgi:hypothetical protein